MDEATLSQQLMAIIIPAAVTAVSLLVSLALFKLKKYVEAQTDDVTIRFAMDQMINLVRSTVNDINENVKEAAEDGTITKDEAVRVKNLAMARVMEQIPTDMKAVLEKSVNSLEEWVDSEIELEVAGQK